MRRKSGLLLAANEQKRLVFGPTAFYTNEFLP